MVIFLSIGMIEKVVEELREGYKDETPWWSSRRPRGPIKGSIRGTLADIAAKVRQTGVEKTALIYVGDALSASQTALGKESRLYYKAFSHGMRE